MASMATTEPFHRRTVQRQRSVGDGIDAQYRKIGLEMPTPPKPEDDLPLARPDAIKKVCTDMLSSLRKMKGKDPSFKQFEEKTVEVAALAKEDIFLAGNIRVDNISKIVGQFAKASCVEAHQLRSLSELRLKSPHNCCNCGKEEKIVRSKQDCVDWKHHVESEEEVGVFHAFKPESAAEHVEFLLRKASLCISSWDRESYEQVAKQVKSGSYFVKRGDGDYQLECVWFSCRYCGHLLLEDDNFRELYVQDRKIQRQSLAETCARTNNFLASESLLKDALW